MSDQPAKKPPVTPRPSAAAWAATALILALTVIALKIEGRVWWCQCRTPRVWVSDVWTEHCSQHLLDPYSVTHVSHGLIFGTLLAWLVPAWSVGRRLGVAVGIAAVWEVAENSVWVIERYRTATMSLNYLGDSVVNATADVLCCAAGFFIAGALGWKRTAALFVATEVALAFLIRDNLTLNVIMLLWPVDAIKQWQAGGM